MNICDPIDEGNSKVTYRAAIALKDQITDKMLIDKNPTSAASNPPLYKV